MSEYQPDGKTRYTVWITNEQKEQLKEIAKELDMPMSQYMRQVIKKTIAERNQ